MPTRAERFRKSVQIVEMWERLSEQLKASQVPEARGLGAALAASAAKERAKYKFDAEAGRAPRGHLEDVHWELRNGLREFDVVESKPRVLKFPKT